MCVCVSVYGRSFFSVIVSIIASFSLAISIIVYSAMVAFYFTLRIMTMSTFSGENDKISISLTKGIGTNALEKKSASVFTFFIFNGVKA